MKSINKTKNLKIIIKKHIDETKKYIHLISKDVGDEIKKQIYQDSNVILFEENYEIDNLLKKNIYSFALVSFYSSLEFHLELTLDCLNKEVVSNSNHIRCLKLMEIISSILTNEDTISKWNDYKQEINNIRLFRNMIVHERSRLYKPFPSNFESSYFEPNIMNKLSEESKIKLLKYYKKKNKNYKKEYKPLFPGMLEQLFEEAGFNLELYIEKEKKKGISYQDYDDYVKLNNYLNLKQDLLEPTSFIKYPKIEFLNYFFNLLEDIYTVVDNYILAE